MEAKQTVQLAPLRVNHAGRRLPPLPPPLLLLLLLLRRGCCCCSAAAVQCLLQALLVAGSA
jgi:hypothetical protein